MSDLTSPSNTVIVYLLANDPQIALTITQIERLVSKYKPGIRTFYMCTVYGNVAIQKKRKVYSSEY